MAKVVKGYAKIRVFDAKEEEEGIFSVDAGNNQRWGEVVEIAKPFTRHGPPDYEVGDSVLIPSLGGFRVEEYGFVYMVFLQTQIIYYDPKQ